MEVYIDDMLVKSTTTELHIAHLSEAFQNPAKLQHEAESG